MDVIIVIGCCEGAVSTEIVSMVTISNTGFNYNSVGDRQPPSPPLIHIHMNPYKYCMSGKSLKCSRVAQHRASLFLFILLKEDFSVFEYM